MILVVFFFVAEAIAVTLGATVRTFFTGFVVVSHSAVFGFAALAAAVRKIVITVTAIILFVVFQRMSPPFAA